MNKSTTFGCLWIALVSLAVMGCIGAPPDEDVASAQDALLTTNLLTTNLLTTNLLTTNLLTTNLLTTNALTTSSLTTGSLLTHALSDPPTREVFEYIVNCALTSDQSVSFSAGGQSYTYAGSIGLAPQWGKANGRCDTSCQEWVSGCLIARLDFLGVERPISIRGANPALTTTQAERQSFPIYEATYYGNVFESPQVLNACLLPGQTSDTRVCGPSLTDCGVTFTGDCLTHCDLPMLDGAFPSCRDKPWWEPGATSYVGSVTVFIEPGEP